MNDGFVWSDKCVVVRHRQPVAVYRNAHDNIALRMPSYLELEGDGVVAIPPECLSDVIKRLQEVAQDIKDNPSNGAYLGG